MCNYICLILWLNRASINVGCITKEILPIYFYYYYCCYSFLGLNHLLHYQDIKWGGTHLMYWYVNSEEKICYTSDPLRKALSIWRNYDCLYLEKEVNDCCHRVMNTIIYNVILEWIIGYLVCTVRFRLLLRSGNLKYTCLWPMFFILKGYDIMTSMYVLSDIYYVKQCNCQTLL